MPIRHYKVTLENQDTYIIETENSRAELSFECKQLKSVTYYDCIEKKNKTIKSSDIRSFEPLFDYSFKKEMGESNDGNNAHGKGTRKKVKPLS